MKKIILSFTAMASLIMASCAPVFADLGDTYSQSCAKYGGRGRVDKKTKHILWHVSHHLVIETFVKNECVQMLLVSDQGGSYGIEDFARIAPDECGRSQTWAAQSGILDRNIAEWSTTDGLVLSALSRDGRLQFSYTWWSKNKGLLVEAPDYGSAPVEDTTGETAL